jgi:hypothetical protein
VLALHGPCVRVTLSGAKWDLDQFDLEPLVGMGVSNEVPDTNGGWAPIVVTLAGGVLTVFDDPAPEPPDDGDDDDETPQR